MFTETATTHISREGLEALLDSILFPAVLVSGKERRIIAANMAAAREAGYGRATLADMPLSGLFPNMTFRDIYTHGAGNAPALAFMQRSNGNSEQVWCRFRPLDLQRQQWMIVFAPWEQYAATPFSEISPRHWLWQQVMKALESPGSDESLQALLDSNTVFMRAAWSAVYLLEAPSFRLHAHSGMLPPDMPLVLSLRQAEVFAHAHQYTPIEVPPTPLHAAALASGTPYLVVVPLNEHHALQGFLVFGYAEVPPREVVAEGKIVAQYLQSLWRHHYNRQKLRLEANRNARLKPIIATMLAHSSEGILIFDASLRLSYLGAAAAQMLGYHSREVKEASLGGLLLGEVSLDAMARKTLALAVPQEAEVHLLRRDGTEFPAEVRMVPVQTETDERPQGLIAFVSDLSEATHYREQNRLLLRRAILGDILASFAHEVRDPLNSISTGLEWLIYSLPDNDDSQRTLKNLQQDVERLNHLVHNLLDYSRARPLQLKPLDVVALLNGIIQRWRRRFEKYRIHVEWEPPQGIPPVYGDRLSLEQVFTNLLDNAIKALSRQQGERFIAVTVSVTDSERGVPWVEINVVDNGPGFDEITRQRLFEPFFTTRENGTGLGLAITKQLITAHKGSIEARSYDQAGTVFHVRLRTVQNQEKDTNHGV